MPRWMSSDFSKIIADVFLPWHYVNKPECSRPDNYKNTFVSGQLIKWI